ncbi:hypothetical protein GCM10023089_23680 [Quisquiliibacterium transsilvanicum]
MNGFASAPAAFAGAGLAVAGAAALVGAGFAETGATAFFGAAFAAPGAAAFAAARFAAAGAADLGDVDMGLALARAQTSILRAAAANGRHRADHREAMCSRASIGPAQT